MICEVEKMLKKWKRRLSVLISITLFACAGAPAVSYAAEETEAVSYAAEETEAASYAAEETEAVSYTAEETALSVDEGTESVMVSPDYGSSLLIKALRGDPSIGTPDKFKTVSFVDLNDYDLTGVKTTDYSANGDKSVLAWFDAATSTFYIGGYGKIIAGDSLAYAFYDGPNIEKITGFDMVDTSHVTNMERMFWMCGYRSKTFTLDLGDHFDTSNVTRMYQMFNRCGQDSTDFTLDLGDNFDTSKVTTMYSMFMYCGQNSNVFTLNLGKKFNTSKVKNMAEMFYYCGEKSEVMTLDLGDQFDTSNVTDMNKMLQGCGRSSRTFTLNLGSKFNTEKVSDMALMFYECGEASQCFKELDLSSFTVSATTKISSMAERMSVTTFRFGPGWADAVLPEGGIRTGIFYSVESLPTQVYGATPNLLTYGWAEDNRPVTFPDKNYYTVTAAASDENGGSVSGGGELLEGLGTTLHAEVKDGYRFDGWYDGETKVCDTEDFVIDSVTESKTYTAKFTVVFDFTSLRTLYTTNISVDHEAKTIDLYAESGKDYVTILVHQKDVIPGGVFKMASYLGNKVVYNSNGSYRIYFVNSFIVPVKANITVRERTEQYLVRVHFDDSKVDYNFTGLKGEGFSAVTVDHEAKTIHVTAGDDADHILLYVNQHDTIYGGKLRMASYLGNKVVYDPAGKYTIYANGKNSVSVKVNITINEVAEQYLVTVDFPGIVWGFDNIRAENVTDVIIDHEAKTIRLMAAENCNDILLYIDQECPFGMKGQVWMKSYMGNAVTYHAADRTYTIAKKNKDSFYVKVKITMLGETRYYDMYLDFSGKR